MAKNALSLVSAAVILLIGKGSRQAIEVLLANENSLRVRTRPVETFSERTGDPLKPLIIPDSVIQTSVIAPMRISCRAAPLDPGDRCSTWDDSQMCRILYRAGNEPPERSAKAADPFPRQFDERDGSRIPTCGPQPADTDEGLKIHEVAEAGQAEHSSATSIVTSVTDTNANLSVDRRSTLSYDPLFSYRATIPDRSPMSAQIQQRPFRLAEKVV